MRTPLDIPPGLVSDDTTFAAAGAWTDASLVRFWRDRPQVVGGWQRFNPDPLTGICRKVYGWTNNAALLHVAFGTHSALQVAVGGGLYTITPVGLTAGSVDGTAGLGFGTGLYSTGTYGGASAAEYWPRTWSLSAYGETLMACPRNGTIYQWSNNTAVVAVAVTNAPANVTYMLVNDERQVMAFGCNEETSGTFNPMCIRFSDVANATQWTTTSSTLSGEVILSGGGRIVAAAKVGAYIFVWTDDDLYIGSFVGSASQVWRFDRVGQHCGLIGPNGFIVQNQMAYWMSPDFQFRSCVLGGAPQTVVSPVQATVQANFSPLQQDKVTLASISSFGEVWCFYPDSRDGMENSRYVSVSLLNGAWSRGILARTAFVDAQPQSYPLGVDASSIPYYHEVGQSADGGSISAYIESAAQYIGDADRYMMLKGVWPDFQSQTGPINLTIYTRKQPQATDRTRGPYAMTINQSKRDFLASGRCVRVRVASNTAPSFWRLGKLEFETDATGMQ